MMKLSNDESLPLILALKNGIVTTGIQETLEAFGRAGEEPANLCARSILKNLLNGNDYRTSFLNTIPALPDILNRIITAGFLKSVLDYALEDICNVLTGSEGLKNVEHKLASLAEKYERIPISLICQGCFEREFLQILSRAETENAVVVQLEQIDESFLNQIYKSEENVTYKKPSNSLAYRTLLLKLDSAFRSGGILRTAVRTYQIRKPSLDSYVVMVNNKAIVRIEFRGIVSSTENSTV